VACQHFVDCVEKGVRPRSGGSHGLDVVRVLEAADASIREGGRSIDIEPADTRASSGGA
jgi:predicted dehydrogenase